MSINDVLDNLDHMYIEIFSSLCNNNYCITMKILLTKQLLFANLETIFSQNTVCEELSIIIFVRSFL